jgi:lysophospholipase L1-like esterase
VKRKSIGRIVAVLLAVVAAALTAIAVVHARRDGDVPSTRPSVLFVGDSYTVGAMLRNAQDSYPELIAVKASWDLHVDAQGATGFISDGQGTGNGDTSRLIDRLAADKRSFPAVDLLIVDAGRNDLGDPPEDVTTAISDYLTEARKLWPSAKIVEIFPAYVSTSGPFEGYPELLDKISASVSAVGGTLVDPIAEGWYSNVNALSLTASDHLHPNLEGHAYIADRLLASLRRIGIVPP